MSRRVFVISVAAELAGMHPQTLRQYDRLGLVQPGRAGGGGRRYSERDVALLREVQRFATGIRARVNQHKIIGPGWHPGRQRGTFDTVEST